MTKLYPFFCLCLVVLFSHCHKEETLDAAIPNYLSSNRILVDVTEAKSLNPYLNDSLMKANDIVMVGENHSVSNNAPNRLLFIRGVHQFTDTLYYFPELSFAACQLLNHYLKTGDEVLLQFLYTNYKGSLEYTKENYAFWQDLRAYTQGLASTKKLIVVGLDLEHQSLNALRYMRLLFESPPPQSIDTIVTNIKNKASLNYRLASDQNWLRQYRELILSNQSAFRSYLGDKYNDLEFTLINMQQTVDFMISNSSLPLRENKIWDNFKRLYPTLPQGKWFGQWGSYHALQRSSTHPALASFMRYNLESPVKGRVVTFFSFYENCNYMNPNTGDAFRLTNIQSENPFSPLATTSYTAFKLDKADSPFRSRMLWWGTEEKLTEGNTLDYFQYVLYVKNSSAMKIYK
ncbi:MAG: hypothetical protein JNL70_16150 [Saprospiraceae bacterium]|nr:hypothetical protein [Saprospiraceae bacterium]